MSKRISQSDAAEWPPIPPRVHDLTGSRFGRLTVLHFAGINRHHHSTWCCECECGNYVRIESGALLGRREHGGETRSCGCLRSDPDAKRANWRKVAPAKRRKICGAMCRSVKKHKPAYSMSLDRAAELMGITPDRLRTLCQDNTIGSRVKSGVLWVSSQDVGDYIAEQKRLEVRKCKTREKVLAKARNLAAAQHVARIQ